MLLTDIGFIWKLACFIIFIYWLSSKLVQVTSSFICCPLLLQIYLPYFHFDIFLQTNFDDLFCRLNQWSLLLESEWLWIFNLMNAIKRVLPQRRIKWLLFLQNEWFCRCFLRCIWLFILHNFLFDRLPSWLLMHFLHRFLINLFWRLFLLNVRSPFNLLPITFARFFTSVIIV